METPLCVRGNAGPACGCGPSAGCNAPAPRVPYTLGPPTALEPAAVAPAQAEPRIGAKDDALAVGRGAAVEAEEAEVGVAAETAAETPTAGKEDADAEADDADEEEDAPMAMPAPAANEPVSAVRGANRAGGCPRGRRAWLAATGAGATTAPGVAAEAAL